MDDRTGADSLLRAINGRIAAAYDRVPYDPAASPDLDPDAIFRSTGQTHNPTNTDILDLGCGTGAQLARAGTLTSGQLVGIDLSQSACDKARERTASIGTRCRIICADFLDVQADDLGTFDLIYHVGVLYVTPPAVQGHLLDLIARCLKPGGVAVMSYYAGVLPLIMAGLHSVLRGAVDPEHPPETQVATARRQIQNMAEVLGRSPGDHRLVMAILKQVHDTPDVIFFHEMLNHSFTAFSTTQLEAALAPHGVHFHNWMQPAPLPDNITGTTRAAAADALIFGTGGYFYGLFKKD